MPIEKKKNIIAWKIGFDNLLAIGALILNWFGNKLNIYYEKNILWEKLFIKNDGVDGALAGIFKSGKIAE